MPETEQSKYDLLLLIIGTVNENLTDDTGIEINWKLPLPFLWKFVELDL